MDKPWKIVLLLLGIFITGATTGGLVAVRLCRDQAERPRALPVDQWAQERLGRLIKRLNLTPEQSEKLRPILRSHMEELGRIRAQMVSDSRPVIERMEREIAIQLTPEQLAEYEKVKQETAERFRRMQQDRERGKNRPDFGGPDSPRRRLERPPGDSLPPPPEPKAPPGGV
jgi:hypothetical protein